MDFEKIENIVWDWNGTLLNDVEICVKSMNVLLAKRGLPLLDIVRYREIFTFPVINYYRELGFDFETEPFEIPAMEFIDEFGRNLTYAPLSENSIEVLDFFADRSCRQFVLSAMEHKALINSVSIKGITKYFQDIRGINDHYANGKEHIAYELISKNHLDKNKTVLIGDTLHDREVAGKIGIHCLLISAGHQSYERLESGGIKSLSHIRDLMKLF